MNRSLTGLLMAMLVLPAAADAQTKPEDKVKVRVRLAPEQKPIAVMTPYAIFRSSPTAVMVMQSPEFDARSHVKKGPRIDVYDYEKLIHERSMEPAMKRMGQEQLFLDDLVWFNGKPVMIARNRRDEDVSLFYQFLDPHLTKPPPSFDPICSFPVQAKVFNTVVVKPGTLTRDRFRAFAAHDSSHMVICGPHMVDSDGGAFRLLTAVDRRMSPVWQHVLRIDARAERSELLDAAIDSKGVGYVLLRFRAKGRPYGGGAFTYETLLYRFDAGDIAPMPVGLPDGSQPTGGILRDFGKGIVWAGIYATNGEGSGKLEGNFIATMEPDSTGNLPARWLPFTGEPLSDEEISERNEASEVAEDDDDEDSKKKKSEKRLDWVTDVVDLLERGDGGWYIVNEVGFTVSRIDGETRRARRTYYHGPVLARSLDKDWNQQWSTLYRRWAITGSAVTGKLLATVFDKQLYLFLIDSDELAEQRKLKERISPKDPGKPNSVYAFFDDKGGFRIKTILKGDVARDFIGGWDLVRSGKDQYLAFGADAMGVARYLPVRIDLSKDAKK
ncbi:MAG: hypothetical protein IPF41_09430 [Flavobacteriales bacterium]|nr:hypothetical protein [Flavobacteriales bacterium]